MSHGKCKGYLESIEIFLLAQGLSKETALLTSKTALTDCLIKPRLKATPSSNPALNEDGDDYRTPTKRAKLEC